MAVVMMSTANLAYRKAVARTRERSVEGTNASSAPWLKHFVEQLPEDDSSFALTAMVEPERHRKERLLRSSANPYFSRFAWFMYLRITSTAWFESLVILTILMVGVATVIDLEYGGADPAVALFVSLTGIITIIIFTLECAVKIIAEGPEPLRYFTHPEDGYFNTFDFLLNAVGLCTLALRGRSAGAIAGLRLLRLVRLLTLIKSVPVLRAIITGLIVGMKSVCYIVILLFLVMYIFAILGVISLGSNDPARFSTVRIAMLTLFQVSTLTGWSSIACKYGQSMPMNN